MTSARKLARYLIGRIKKRMADNYLEEFDVTPLKLQKLLYYCQGYSLALTGEPAFSDKIEAWRYGPVVDNVYQEYKKYSGGIIPYNDVEDEEIFDDALRGVVDLVLADKAQYSGEKLARATHNEAPWRNNFLGDCGGVYANAEIPESDIKNYFVHEFEKREEDYDGEDEYWGKLGVPVSVSELEAAIEEI